jgi:hypothetical protein
MTAGMKSIAMMTSTIVTITRRLIAHPIFANLFLLAKSVASIFAEGSFYDLFGAEALQPPW